MDVFAPAWLARPFSDSTATKGLVRLSPIRARTRVLVIVLSGVGV